MQNRWKKTNSSDQFWIYDIYFLDGSGQRYEVTEKMSVTISLNGEYRSPTVYYVSSADSAVFM